MKRIVGIIGIAALIFGVSGCAPQPTFNGSMKVNKTNGAIESVEVTFTSSSSYTLRNRQDATKLIDQVESMLADLKAIRDQMPVDEKDAKPAPVPTQPKQ